jgi:hypothetical protein
MRLRTWTTAADAPALPPPSAFFSALEKTADQSTEFPATASLAVPPAAMMIDDDAAVAGALKAESLLAALILADDNVDGDCAVAIALEAETSSLALAGSTDEATKAVVITIRNP